MSAWGFAVLLWASVASAASPNSFPAERVEPFVVLEDANGALFKLVQKTGVRWLERVTAPSSVFGWELAAAESLAEWNGITGYTASQASEVIAQGRALSVRRVQGEWEDREVRSLPPGAELTGAAIDGAGGLHLFYGGQSLGICRLLSFDRVYCSDWNSLVTSAMPRFTRMIANPYGPGLLALGDDQSLWGLNIDVRNDALTLSGQVLLSPGSVSAVAADRTNLVGIVNGEPALISAEGKIQRLRLPEHAAREGEIKLYSNEDFQREENRPRTHYRFDPADLPRFFAELEQARQELRTDFVDQEDYADALIEAYGEARVEAFSPPSEKPIRRHRVLLVTGPTGSGKSYGARRFATRILGDSRRYLEIDGTQYASGENSLALNRLFGGPRGTKDWETSRGILTSFFAGRGKGRSVILIDEFDKAHPSFAQAFMQIWETGVYQGGDNVVHQVGECIFIVATNKGANEIFPRDRVAPLSRGELRARLATFTDERVRQLFIEPDAKNLYDQTKTLDPSILQRIDHALAIGPPSLEGAITIGRRVADHEIEMRAQSLGVRIVLEDDLLGRIVEAVYQPKNGVRAVERAVKRLIKRAIKEGVSVASADRGDIIRLKYVAPTRDARASVQAIVSGRPFALEFPQVGRGPSPLMDPAVREELRTLEARLNGEVIGQETAVRMASRTIRARRSDADAAKKPSAMLSLGPSGTGKSELGRAIARTEYGDERKMITFDMGRVSNDLEFNNIFSSARGVVGSDTPAPFEQFLRDHPEGGVFQFDEIGNMGGGNAQIKNGLLKKLYLLIDEGAWVSPQGKRYDLTKYFFHFTSNEGEEAFQSLPTDDLRMAVWRKLNRRDYIREGLVRRYGWPEAFVNRFEGRITVFKPLLMAERRAIAKRMVEGAIASLVRQYGIKPIIFTDGFYAVMAGSFFSHSEGARAMRGVATETLPDLLRDVISDGLDEGWLDDAEMSITLSDNYQGRYAYAGALPPRREVMLRLELQLPDGQEFRYYDRDLTSDVVPRELTKRDDLYRVAVHEAGHAIANDPAFTREVTDFITVRAEGGFGGYARYESGPKPLTRTRKHAIAEIARMLGGRVGEDLMGLEKASGWSNDMEKATEEAQKTIAERRLTERAFELPVKDGKVDPTHPIVQEEIKKLLEDAYAFAVNRVRALYPEFRALAGALVSKGDLTRSEIEAIVKHARTGSLRRYQQTPLRCEEAFKTRHLRDES